jgi:hypothetical protein
MSMRWGTSGQRTWHKKRQKMGRGAEAIIAAFGRPLNAENPLGSLGGRGEAKTWVALRREIDTLVRFLLDPAPKELLPSITGPVTRGRNRSVLGSFNYK